MRKEKLLISFSGGRTSAFMLKLLLDSKEYNDRFEYKVVFANTGKEDEQTLVFVDECQRQFGCEIVWIEAKHRNENGETFSPNGYKVDFKIVNFETASRNGEPFEEFISVQGIPCQITPRCSSQLKKLPIDAYMKSIGWRDCFKAIGIRVDEIDRMNPNFKKERIIYPLIGTHPTTRKQIEEFWSNNHFNLKVDPLLGNCDCCWKKSFKNLTKIAKKFPDRFDWWEQMTEKYASVKTEVKATKQKIEKESVSFYRQGMKVKDIFEMQRLNDQQLSLFSEQFKLDGCSESCEVYQ